MKEYYFINGEVYPVMSAQEGIQIFLDNPFAQFTAQEYLKKFPAIWKRTRGITVPKSAVKDVQSLWQYMIQQKLVQKATPGEIRKFNNEEKPVRSAKPKSDRKKSSPAKKGVSGVYDPNIFKLVFLAGGPGSGKSAIAKALFGMQGQYSYTGLKNVNSDRFFEYLLKKEGIPSDFRNMPKEQFEKITQGEGSVRDRSKNLNVAQFDSWIKGRLGVIIDGTGDNAKKLINQAKYLKDTYGYEPFMVFVNTTLNKAIERNNKRDRKLPEALVREIWNSAQQALKEYKAYFKSNFVEIDNSRDVSKIEIDKKIQKEVAAFLRKPNTNAKAKEWIESELSKKSKGITGNTYKDRYGKVVKVGDAIRIKVLTGRYGQTQMYEGVVTKLEKGQVELDGGKPLTYTADYKHNDYEHGHHIYVEKINKKDIKENLRVPKKFVPTFSGTINGKKFAVSGRDNFEKWLKKNYPKSVFGAWNTLYNYQGFRYGNGNYYNREGLIFDKIDVYESAESGQGFMYVLLIPKKKK
jgi:predicted kinase